VYFDRSSAIDLVVQTISAAGISVGDHIAPPDAGWSQGQPGSGTFTAYTVVFAMQSQVRPTTLCVKGYEIGLVLQTRTFGANRSQADHIAAKVREALHGITVEIPGFKANPLWCSAIGAVDRMDDTDPKMWRINDSYTADCFPT